MVQNDVTLRIGGEAGMGLESSGAAFAKALMRGGLQVFGVPDFYSRIRGGHNFFTLRAAREPLQSIADPVHLLLALDMDGTTVNNHGEISEATINSLRLAREKGAFPLFDADRLLASGMARRLPEGLRAEIRAHGLRNSHLLSIAPTGTISPAER